MASEPIYRVDYCTPKSQPNARPLPLLALEALLGEPVVSPTTLSFVHELGDTETNITEQAWQVQSGLRLSVCVRSFRPGFFDGLKSPFRTWVREATRLRRLKHLNLTGFLGLGCYNPSTWGLVRSSLFIVEEFGGPTNLSRMLKAGQAAPLGLQDSATYSFFDALRWMIELAEVLAYLHANEVYHGDVCCRNIFFTSPEVQPTDNVFGGYTLRLGDLKPHRDTYQLDLGSPLPEAGSSHPLRRMATQGSVKRFSSIKLTELQDSPRGPPEPPGQQGTPVDSSWLRVRKQDMRCASMNIKSSQQLLLPSQYSRPMDDPFTLRLLQLSPVYTLPASERQAGRTSWTYGMGPTIAVGPIGEYYRLRQRAAADAGPGNRRLAEMPLTPLLGDIPSVPWIRSGAAMGSGHLMAKRHKRASQNGPSSPSPGFIAAEPVSPSLYKRGVSSRLKFTPNLEVAQEAGDLVTFGELQASGLEGKSPTRCGSLHASASAPSLVWTEQRVHPFSPEPTWSPLVELVPQACIRDCDDPPRLGSRSPFILSMTPPPSIARNSACNSGRLQGSSSTPGGTMDWDQPTGLAVVTPIPPIPPTALKSPTVTRMARQQHPASPSVRPGSANGMRKAVSFVQTAPHNKLCGQAIACMHVPPEAPKQGTAKAACTAEGDTYAFARVMYQVFMRREFKPEGETDMAQWLWIRQHAQAVAEGYRDPLPSYWPKELREVISRCWNADPEARPDMASVADRLRLLYQHAEFRWLLQAADRQHCRRMAEKRAEEANERRIADTETCSCTNGCTIT